MVVGTSCEVCSEPLPPPKARGRSRFCVDCRKARKRASDAGGYQKNREKRRAVANAYRAARADEDRARSAAWHAANREAALSRQAAYRAANRDEYNAKRRARTAERRAEDVEKRRAYAERNRDKVNVADRARAQTEKRQEWHRRWNAEPKRRLRRNLSTAIAQTLRGTKKRRSWEALVGYTTEDLRSHLERQFAKGMTWENYGSVWHLDHILPVTSFDFHTPEDPEFMACWALSNLQPLWARENIRKSNRRLVLI